MTRVKTLRSIMVLLILALAPCAWGQQVAHLQIQPATLHIGTFFNGSRIALKGQIPADCDIVVRLMGQRGELHLKKKGKLLGVLWMNLASLTFENVPSVLLIYAPKELEKQLRQGQGSGGAASRLGLAQLDSDVSIEPQSEDKTELIRELIKLKQQGGLYIERIGGVRYQNASQDQKSFATEIEIPSQFTPGEYQIETYLVRDGRIVYQDSRPYRVDLVGLPAFISNLAFNHGALYGVLATIVAILAGLLMGLIFGSGKGAH